MQAQRGDRRQFFKQHTIFTLCIAQVPTHLPANRQAIVSSDVLTVFSSGGVGVVFCFFLSQFCGCSNSVDLKEIQRVS